MHSPVVGDEGYLSPAISGQLVQLVQETLAKHFEVSVLNGLMRDVQEKDVDSWLRRSEHVLRRRDELNGCCLEMHKRL